MTLTGDVWSSYCFCLSSCHIVSRHHCALASNDVSLSTQLGHYGSSMWSSPAPGRRLSSPACHQCQTWTRTTGLTPRQSWHKLQKVCVCNVPDRPSSRAEWVLVAGCLVVSVVSVPGGRLRGSSGLTPALLADTGARNQSTSHRPRAPSQGEMWSGNSESVNRHSLS